MIMKNIKPLMKISSICANTKELTHILCRILMKDAKRALFY